jgi:zinc protease
MANRPAPGAPRDYQFPTVTRLTLANGLRIAVASMPRLPIVTVLAVVDAGAERDPRGQEGIASLTARALTEGAGALDGAALTERFELLGSGLDAGSDWDDAVVHLSVTPSRIEAAMALLADVLRAPLFAERDIERLKAERLSDLLQQQVEPRGLATDKFDEFLFEEGSRYRRPEGGLRETVSALQPTDVRAFHARHYVPDATTLIFTGDITVARATALAERIFGSWAGGGTPPRAVNDRTVGGARRVRVVHKPDAPQSELRVGHRGLARPHPDYFPVVVMNALLGGLFSSRINLNLREKNAFTYGAHSGFDWRRGAGPFVVSTAVKTEVTAAATQEILKEIDAMRADVVSEEELSLATAYLDGVFPIRYETTSSVASAIASATVFGLEDEYFTTYRAKVRAVTAADVRRAAETYLHPDELLILAVGDAEAIREPMAALGIGELSVHPAGDDA